MVIQAIAEALDVAQSTITEDLRDLEVASKSPRPKSASNPKGAGRPKGSGGAQAEPVLSPAARL